jgi:hypothetical protein
MTVTYDSEAKIYRLEDGRTPARVSSVLDLYFPFPVQFMPADAAITGTVRHEFYHRIAQNPLEELEEPDPRIAGPVAAFRKFMAEVKPVYISGELPYFDPILNVCGTPDLVAEISSRLSVVDFKPASKSKRTQAQTAAYKTMLNRNGVPVLDRYELRLSDGTYRLEKHTDDGDLIRWPALVAGYHAAKFYKGGI